jgi:lysophospholipase L1-like esterase
MKLRTLSCTGFLFFSFLIDQSSLAQPYKRICVMGSSTAYGYFGNPPTISRDSAWAFKLKKYYKDLGVIDTLFNIATNGIDCYTGMPTSYVPPPGRSLPDNRFNISKAVKLLPKPDVIIVNFPTNQYDWLDPYEVINCLKVIKDSANINGINCYITTTQPRDNFNAAERLKLKELKRLIDSTFGNWAIDFWTDIVQDPPIVIRPEYAYGDGVHLNPAGHTVLFNNVVQKNIFFTALPLSITEFNARKNGSHVDISWTSTQEESILRYEIERSADGIRFNTLQLQMPANISSAPQHYTFSDMAPLKGNNYYRIVAIQQSGVKIYSGIQKINMGNRNSIISNIYVSNAGDQINVSLNSLTKEKMQIYLSDMMGRKIFQADIWVDQQLNYPINIAGLSAGTYSVIVNGGKSSDTRLFIKK